jgi:hypothetical protein
MTERRKLAHDVRNGMNTVLLNMQCLRISKGSDAVECLDAILNAADSIVVLIDQLDALPDDPASAPAAS